MLISFCVYGTPTNKEYPISYKKAIDTTEIVSIFKTNQFIRIKGDNDKNPLLLYLNGGPGDSVLDQMDNMFGTLQKNFIVVLWDQRNSGKTASLGNEHVQLTQDVFIKDTYLLIQYLLKKFNREKLVLLGHSYGTTLGFDIAKNHPELLHYFVPVNPVVNQIESEKLAVEMLKKQAQKSKNNKAINELAKVTIPFEDGEDLYYARKWLFDFEGKSFAKKKAFKKRIFSWSSTWLELFNEASKENLLTTTKKIDCPIYFIIGEKDYQTNFKITQKYYQLLNAPKKDMHLIEDAGHLIPYTHDKAFQELIIEKVLPTLKLNFSY